MRKIYLAGGCFWGTQHFLSLIPGVIKAEAGYANGTKRNPSYQEVCSKLFGFAETVEVEYDENKLKLENLLRKFFLTIDPTSIDKQGGDVGLQYRTGIYYVDDESRETAEVELNELQRKFSKRVQVELKQLENFYPAEDYHQDYLEKNPGGYCHIPHILFEKAKE